MKPILFYYWDLSQHEKCMPPSPNLDGLPIMTPFAKWPPAKIDRDKILGSKPMLYTWCQGDAGCILGVSLVMGYILCVRMVQVVTLV